jgi:transposase InsO family protein
MATTALSRAIVIRQPKPGLIHHSDRGSQYCSNDDRDLLEKYSVTASMHGKGNCCHNAMVETVFRTIKSEPIWRTSFQTTKEAEIWPGKYIDGFCNLSRRHSALGYKSPIKFEAGIANKQ